MVRQRRGNWGLRLLALASSAAAFVGFWQLAVHNPHPAVYASPGQTATPTEDYSLPTGSVQYTPLPLPTAPNTSTGVSH